MIAEAERTSELTLWDRFSLALSGTATRRGLTLTFVIFSLQIVLFWKQYLGIEIPPWDFLGSYHGDAFAWWGDGGFFEQSEWVPYVWGGYPSAVILQNSAWYLPVGFAALFGPYTLQSAAIVSALHVAFGAYGMYFLLRALKARFSISVFAAVAMFFGVGFYSNASHIDIARAYAWLPWILLVLLPVWKWKSWWGIPVAAILIWQALTGIYPGTAIASVYVLVPWVIVAWVIYKPSIRSYLVPLCIAGIGAVLLAMPRLVPYASIDDGEPSNSTADLLFEPSLFGTLLFGYGIQHDLPNDVTMRSFFVVTTAIVLAIFARWSEPIGKLGFAIGIPAFLLGMPFFPWFTAAQNLPGLDLSRFTMSDFKLFMVAAGILLACSGLRNLAERNSAQKRPRSIFIRLLAAWSLLPIFGILAVLGPQNKIETIPPLILLCVILSLVSAFVLRDREFSYRKNIDQLRERTVQLFIVGVIILTAASGTVWAYTTAGPWAVNRLAAENITYGGLVGDYIDQDELSEAEITQRPPRTPLPEGFGLPDIHSNLGNSSYYSGELSIAGLVNMKNSETNLRLREALTDPMIGPNFADFLALPGSLIKVSEEGVASQEQLVECNSGVSCGIDFTPISYDVSELSYRVALNEPATVLLNESFFEGWKAEACFLDEKCEDLTPVLGEYGTIQIDLPQGEFELNLQYSTPGKDLGWMLFSIGTALILLSIPVTVLVNRRIKANEQ